MASQITIDPTDTIQRTRLIKGKSRVDTYLLASCICGTRWYIRFDAIKYVNMCQQCSQIANAKKGYAATAAKYGERFALRWWREWRLEHPTNLERIVNEWLSELGVDYEREYWFVTHDNWICLIDFMVNGGALAVEVNGTHWHDMPHVITADERKADALHYAGIPLLTLAEDEVLNGQGYARLQSVLTLHTATLVHNRE